MSILVGDMGSAALITECGQYRYTLYRGKGDARELLFVLFNPSTADHERDDRTVMRCNGFAKHWGYTDANGNGCFTVVNLYAYRATNPRVLRSVDDPVGRNNDYWISQCLESAEMVVCGWGNNAIPTTRDRVREFWDLAGKGNHRPKLHCFGCTQQGMPRHPLYIPKSEELRLWQI